VRVAARRAFPLGVRIEISVVAALEAAEVAHSVVAGVVQVYAEFDLSAAGRPSAAIVAPGSRALAARRPLASIYRGAGGRSALIADPSDRAVYCWVGRRLSRIVPSMRSAGSSGLLFATTSQREDKFAG
jgi:hypothetical protein